MSATAAERKNLAFQLESPQIESLQKSNSRVTPRRDLQNRLQQAISVFNQVSTQLTHSYCELEAHIGALQEELAESTEARLQEHSAKELLVERMKLVLDAMPVAVVLLDGSGEVVQSNELANRLLGNEICERRWIDIINESISPQAVDGHEILLKNGRLVSIATQSMANEPGQIIVITDQTETRKLQAKINHNRKLSEMGQMTASLAHQIRTPLATASLYADHLANKNLTEDRRLRYAGKLKERLLQLEQQVSDMLIFSKSGITLKNVLSASELLDILSANVNDLSQLKGVDIELPKQIPNARLRCNIDLLASVFSNLIDNSIQACLEANIDPGIKVSVQELNRKFLLIQVHDNGPGVAQAIENQVLEPFFTTKSSGTGLGLAVARAVIEAHGGSFTLTNNSGPGASANVVLPIIQESI